MMLWSKGCAMTGDMLSGFQNGTYVNLPFWNEGKFPRELAVALSESMEEH